MRTAWRGLAALVLIAAAPIQSVPASWVAYATGVGQSLQDGLANDADPVAQRLHAFLDARPGDSGAPVTVRLWFDSRGQVVRSDFPSLGSNQADQDLRRLLTAHKFGAPPAGLSQPVVLRLRPS